MIERKEFRLKEYINVFLSKELISMNQGEIIWNKYSKQVSVGFPSPVTYQKWKLCNQGWAGYIPITDDCLLILEPKAPIKNIFKMFEYAYELKRFKFFEETIEVNSLVGFYNYLAGVLAERIISRSRKGFYKEYRDEKRKLPYIRGRLDWQNQLRSSNDVHFVCQYQDCDYNNEDNQIMLWTLYVITRSGLCDERTLNLIHKAFRSLQKIVELNSFSYRSCYGRGYNRLNYDYQQIHFLCGFFLENSGPQLLKGEKRMIPFVVNMANLFELFFANWLKKHLPEHLGVKVQEKVSISGSTEIKFYIDLVIYDKKSGEDLVIVDTKYKVAQNVTSSDFSQVVTYALAKNCKEAVLIYPEKKMGSYNGTISDIRVRGLAFDITGNIDKEGELFLENFLQRGCKT